MSYDDEIALQRSDDAEWWNQMRAHHSECRKSVAECRTCSDYFELTPFTQEA